MKQIAIAVLAGVFIAGASAAHARDLNIPVYSVMPPPGVSNYSRNMQPPVILAENWTERTPVPHKHRR